MSDAAQPRKEEAMSLTRNVLAAVLAVSFGAGIQSASAGVVMSEDFNYADSTLANWNAGAGFDASSAWMPTVLAPPTVTLATGLGSGFTNGAIGNLSVAGGAAQVVFSGGDPAGFVRPVNTAVTSGDVWIAFLNKPVVLGSYTGTRTDRFYQSDAFGFITPGSASATDIGYWGDWKGGRFFIETGNNNKATGTKGGAEGIQATPRGAIAADRTWTGDTTASPTFTPYVAGIEYLIVAKYAGIDTAAPVATKWVLTAENFQALTALNEAALDANCFAKGMHTGNVAIDIKTSDLLTFIDKPYGASAVAPSTYVFDEIRVGTNLADVVAVPEPATSVLVGFGALALAARRRRAA